MSTDPSAQDECQEVWQAMQPETSGQQHSTLRADTMHSVLTHRRSVRQFSQAQVSQSEIERIIEAGIYAPSGSNAQNQRFLLLESNEEKAALGRIRFVWPYPSAEKMRQKRVAGLIGQAPVVIAIFADTSLTDRRDNGEYYIWEALEIQNCAASIENMLNMATALGIGSCWLSATPAMTRSRLLSGLSWASAFAGFDVPVWYRIQGIIILGHPSGGLDELGFPKGERMHGASAWSPTARQALSHYLIPRRESPSTVARPLSLPERVWLRLCTAISGVLLKLLQWLDHKIYQLEVRQALQNPAQQKKRHE